MRLSLPLLSLCLALSTSAVLAQEFPREGVAGIENGKAAPFVGRWEMGFPENGTTTAITELVGCADPVVIEAATADHIRYVAPNTDQVDPAISLSAVKGRTNWVPVAGGPSYVTVWRSADSFYLYEMETKEEADWSGALLYKRCN